MSHPEEQFPGQLEALDAIFVALQKLPYMHHACTVLSQSLLEVIASDSCDERELKKRLVGVVIGMKSIARKYVRPIPLENRVH